MSTFLDYNPDTGVWHEEDFNHATGEMTIHTRGDCQPSIDYAKAQRNSGINDKVGEFALYAHIPVPVQVAMLDKGIKFHKKEHLPRVIKEIENNYPHLKTSNLRHSLRTHD